jgi:hypothetical protein
MFNKFDISVYAVLVTFYIDSTFWYSHKIPFNKLKLRHEIEYYSSNDKTVKEKSALELS